MKELLKQLKTVSSNVQVGSVLESLDVQELKVELAQVCALKGIREEDLLRKWR